MLTRLISFLRSRPYRPEVTIFTRQWREDLQALHYRLRADLAFCRDWPYHRPLRRRSPRTREERKPGSRWPTN